MRAARQGRGSAGQGEEDLYLNKSKLPTAMGQSREEEGHSWTKRDGCRQRPRVMPRTACPCSNSNQEPDKGVTREASLMFCSVISLWYE